MPMSVVSGKVEMLLILPGDPGSKGDRSTEGSPALFGVSRAGRLTATDQNGFETGQLAATRNWIGRPERLSQVHR